MSNEKTLLVLLVEDDSDDMTQLLRDLPSELNGSRLAYDPCDKFEKALARIESRRYDLILSDTYSGTFRDRNAFALKLVKQYRSDRFCPLILFSNGTKPHGLKTSTFVLWVEKDKIEGAMGSVLDTGVPQLARTLHDDLDRSAGSYLWGFLEENWEDLCGMGSTILERLVKRRAAIQLGSFSRDGGPMEDVEGLELYIYPAIDQDWYCLGDLLRKKRQHSDLHVVLTPHCHLTVQVGQKKPRADHVLVARMRLAEEVLEAEGANWKGNNEDKQDKLRRRTMIPSQIGQPRGRYCFLPGFMDIPHSYCDLMTLESIPIGYLKKRYERVATLTSPFAEAIQECLTQFYGAIGLPSIRQEGVQGLIP